MKLGLRIPIGAALLWVALTVIAHHSYAMFDASQRKTLVGTLAKVEWGNPHVFVWMYVRAASGKYDLYALENGSVSILARMGWTKASMVVGDKYTVDYVPLRDGRNGGYFLKATDASGKVLLGDPGAIGGTQQLGVGPEKSK